MRKAEKIWGQKTYTRGFYNSSKACCVVALRRYFWGFIIKVLFFETCTKQVEIFTRHSLLRLLHVSIKIWEFSFFENPGF